MNSDLEISFRNQAQPLIWLSEASIAIYSDCIVQQNGKRVENSTSGSTVGTLDDLETEKVIYFSSSDYTFRVGDETLEI